MAKLSRNEFLSSLAILQSSNELHKLVIYVRKLKANMNKNLKVYKNNMASKSKHCLKLCPLENRSHPKCD